MYDRLKTVATIVTLTLLSEFLPLLLAADVYRLVRKERALRRQVQAWEDEGGW